MDSRERNERTLARALGELIPRLKDPRIPLVVTVERVRLNADFSQAKVLISTLNEDDMPEFQAALERAGGFLQRELAQELDLRRTPRLTFTANPLEVI
jgi:ribosome-binding factor A